MFDGNLPVKSSWSRFFLRMCLFTSFFTLYTSIKMFCFFLCQCLSRNGFYLHWLNLLLELSLHNITLSFLKFSVRSVMKFYLSHLLSGFFFLILITVVKNLQILLITAKIQLWSPLFSLLFLYFPFCKLLL